MSTPGPPHLSSPTMKAPTAMPEGAQQRRAVLERLDLARHEPNKVLDAFATSVAEELVALGGLPDGVDGLYAMANLIGDKGQYFAGLHVPRLSAGASQAAPVASRSVSRTMDFNEGWCVHTIERHAALPLRDVYEFPRFGGNRATYRLGARAYLGMRVVDPDTGVPFGTICAVATRPTAWTKSHVDLIKGRALQFNTWVITRDPQDLRLASSPATRYEGVPDDPASTK
ncbi:GAF domain-containing protein [Streptomyces sp. NPDC053474]|uniref:GAF domain-containing protein n=1 Tax=Streptomyces sp. NPDC053474 TaxID=3365704 RepID=UPI0037D4B45B